MMGILLLLCIIIIFTDVIKLSLMPKWAPWVWCTVWVVVAYFTTQKITGLTASEAQEYFSIKSLIVIGCIDLFIMVAYIFYKEKFKSILSYYPGFMLFFPIAVLSYGASRLVAGLDFNVLGMVVAGVTAAMLSGGIMFFRWLRVDSAWLYISSLISLILYILIYGIL